MKFISDLSQVRVHMQVCLSVCESFWVPQLTRSPNACELQSLQSLLLCVFSQIDIVPHGGPGHSIRQAFLQHSSNSDL